MESYLLIFIVAAVAVVLTYYIFSRYLTADDKQQANTTKVTIGRTTVQAEIADTFPKMAMGLMSRKSLPDNGGMLFIFDSDGYHGIWMMNMSISIDIIWMDSEHKIIDMVKDAPPCGMICAKIYRPMERARYVLEVNAGFADEHGIEIGDKAKF